MTSEADVLCFGVGADYALIRKMFRNLDLMKIFRSRFQLQVATQAKPPIFLYRHIRDFLVVLNMGCERGVAIFAGYGLMHTGFVLRILFRMTRRA